MRLWDRQCQSDTGVIRALVINFNPSYCSLFVKMFVTRAELIDFAESSKMLALGTVVTFSGLAYGAWWYNNYLKNQPPTNWVKIAEVSDLCIYPIKSFKSLKPTSFECTPCGPMLGSIRDRTFAVLDDTGKVVSGRMYPKMSQIAPKINGSIVSLSMPGVSTEVEFSLNDIRGEPKKIEIWTVPIMGHDCGDRVAQWISRAILQQESGMRLFYCANQEKAKNVNPKIDKVVAVTNVQLGENDGGFFSDAVSYHLISDTSTQYLNTRSNGEVISSLNFRPNIVVKGEKMIPFEEDHWKWVKIGDTVFQSLSSTTRCIFTTVNPTTGERSKSMEPLTSMKRYRNLRDPRQRQALPGPAMGIYLGARVLGRIHVGDPVYVPEY